MTRPSALNLRVGSAVALPVHLRSLLWALLLAAALLLTVVATLSLGKLGFPSPTWPTCSPATLPPSTCSSSTG